MDTPSIAGMQCVGMLNGSQTSRGGGPKMARILMVAPQPFFRARGTPFSVLHRVRALGSAGHDVHLLTYPFGDDVELAGLRITRCSTFGPIRDVVIGPSAAKLFLDVNLIRETAKALKEDRYDVIHSHEEAAFWCRWFARRYGLPHIYDMHSSLPQQLGNFSRFNIRLIRWVFEKLESGVLTSADGVITICQELAEIAVPRIGDTPHAMIENTADDRQVFPAPERDVSASRAESARPTVLYTGTLEAYQGVDLLLDAFRKVVESLPEARLMMVGGTDEQVGFYRERAAELGIGRNVEFTGTVHPSEIPHYFALADVIVSPRSKGTNTPLKIYGYMRSGKPIVATDLLTHTQTLTSETAFLTPATPGGLAEGMLEVMGDREKAERLAGAALEYANREFSDAAYLEKVNTLFDGVMNRLGRGDAVRSPVV